MTTLDLRALEKAVVASVARLLAPKNREMRARYIKSSHASTESDNSKRLFCEAMIEEMVRNAYLKHYLADIKATFKDEGDAVPACIKGKTLANLTPLGEGADGAVFQLADGSVVKIGDVLSHEERPIPDYYTERARLEIEIATAAGKAGLGPTVLDAYFCCSQTGCKYVIHMTRVEGTTLLKWNRTATEAAKKAMNRKILAQVKKLQRLGISHSDLHQRNIMVAAGKPVFIDFGRSKWMNHKQGKYDEQEVQAIYDLLPDRVDALVALVVIDLLERKALVVT
jgi:predicted Ser/Thr protein kinase